MKTLFALTSITAILSGPNYIPDYNSLGYSMARNLQPLLPICAEHVAHMLEGDKTFLAKTIEPLPVPQQRRIEEVCSVFVVGVGIGAMLQTQRMAVE